MKTRLLLVVLGLALVMALPTAFADEAKPAKPAPAVGDEIVLPVTATIQALNLETRELTVRGPAGNSSTFTVDPRVKRLAEFHVGDLITLDYHAALAAELRAPTEEEKAAPLAILRDAARAEAGAPPAAGGCRILRAVVSIEGLDRPTGTATVRGPGGNYFTVKVKDSAILPKLRIGDTVVVVYTEAFAVRLDKAPARAAS
ncbi:MAG: hypothetical protein WDM96_08590 [Lacunisphaera sp.]